MTLTSLFRGAVPVSASLFFGADKQFTTLKKTGPDELGEEYFGGHPQVKLVEAGAYRGVVGVGAVGA